MQDNFSHICHQGLKNIKLLEFNHTQEHFDISDHFIKMPMNIQGKHSNCRFTSFGWGSQLHLFSNICLFSCTGSQMQHVGPWCLVWDLLLWHMDSLVVALGLHSAQVQQLKLVGLAASLHVGSYFPDQGSNLDHLSWELGFPAMLRTSKEVPCTPFLF